MNVLGLPCCVNQRPTFRPKKRKHHPSGTNVSGLSISDHVVEKPLTATLVSYNLREAVKLPYGEDINQWLAIHKCCESQGRSSSQHLLRTSCSLHICELMDFLWNMLNVIVVNVKNADVSLLFCNMQEYQLIDEAEMEPLKELVGEVLKP
uniref:Uncharacterized protein n=1 Tax=Brassica campestris TaxID=3711 RepID=M4CDM2_BRACM